MAKFLCDINVFTVLSLHLQINKIKRELNWKEPWSDDPRAGY